MMQTARIFFVGGDAAACSATTDMLAAAGVVTANYSATAEEAFEVLSLDHDSEPCFDAILVHLNMPGIDGIEASARIRMMRKYRTIPILVLGVDDDPDVRQLVLLAGAHDYVAMSIESKDLCDRLDAAIQFQREVDQRRVRGTQLYELFTDAPQKIALSKGAIANDRGVETGPALAAQLAGELTSTIFTAARPPA